MIRQSNHLFEHAMPVNHLWKLSDALLNVSKTEKREFMIKLSSEKAAEKIIHDFPQLPIVYKTQLYTYRGDNSCLLTGSSHHKRGN
jgi:hypothetical protein